MNCEQPKLWIAFSLICSVVFLGYFMSLPLSVTIVAMICFNSHAHNYARERLGLHVNPVAYAPILSSTCMVGNSYDMKYSDHFNYLIAGPIAGLITTIVFMFYYFIYSDPLIGEIVKVLCFINILNLSPMPLMDGGGMLRSIGFSTSRFSGFIVVAMSCITPYLLTISLHWIFIVFFIFSVHDLNVLTFYKRDHRKTDMALNYIQFSAYILLLYLFYAIFNDFKGITDTGAMVPFMFSQ